MERLGRNVGNRGRSPPDDRRDLEGTDARGRSASTTTQRVFTRVARAELEEAAERHIDGTVFVLLLADLARQQREIARPMIVVPQLEAVRLDVVRRPVTIESGKVLFIRLRDDDSPGREDGEGAD